MKRYNNLFEKIYSVENLQLADTLARKGKTKTRGVINHDKNRESNILQLHSALKNKTFTTSKCSNFKIKDPKERLISSLPYYPDRIVHHAIMNVLEPIFVSTFTSNTFGGLKGRGIHGAARSIRKALKDKDNTLYCLKLDVKQYYPSIDHNVLKTIIRKKIKDKDVLWLLDDIIDSAPGLPLGNYSSQYFANIYFNYFDHWIKEIKRVKYYFRYVDDVVILSSSKEYLHILFKEINEYFQTELLLTIKGNYQIFPVEARGIDFVGYVFYHSHVLLRKSIKQSFARMVKNNFNTKSLASYQGWIKHCDGKHLIKKLIPISKQIDF